jgi:hypothetical protein
MAGSHNQDHKALGRTTASSLARGGISEQPSVIELTGQIKWFDVAKATDLSFPTMGLLTFSCTSPAFATTIT